MNKKVVLPALILVLILGFGGVLAVTITTFDVSWTQENISFSGNENITRTLDINRFAIVNKAYLNLSGFENTSYTLYNNTFEWATLTTNALGTTWGQPVVRADKIYVSTNKNISVLSSDGTLDCVSDTNRMGNGYLTIGKNHIYIHNDQNWLLALEPTTCAVKWDKILQDTHGVPVIDGEDNLTVVLGNGTIIYMNSTGNVSWGTDLINNMDYTIPAIKGDRIYATTTASAGTSIIHNINKTQGGKLWNVSVPLDCYSPVVIEEGVYTPCGSVVYALNRTDGDGYWNYTSALGISESLVGDTERLYIIVGGAELLRAINITDGTELWTSTLGNFKTFPIITTNGVWVYDNTGDMYLFNKETGAVIHKVENDMDLGKVSIADSKIIGYNGSYHVNTYNIFTNDCEANWTQPRGNINNTGELRCVLSPSSPFNVWLEIGTPNGTREWYYPGKFTDLNNRTGDLSIILNETLDFGNCTGGTLNEENCSITYTFHSDSAGTLEYSDLMVNWTSPYVSECATGNITFNITKWKEENKAKTNGSLEATFTILGVNYTFDIDNHHQDLFCLTPGYSEVGIDAVIEYTNDTNVVRTYWLNNATATNETQDIYLFLLETTNSTSVVVEVIDENYNEMENVYAKMQRYYVGTNTWETVEIGKTDTQGKSIFHVVVEDVYYKFIFEDSHGNILKTTEPMKFVCMPTYEECKYTFQISEDNQNPFSPVAGLPGVSYSLVFDNYTKTVRFTWSDSTGTTQQGRLLVLRSHVLNDTETICDTILVANAGTIACDLSNENGTFSYYSYIYRSPGKIIQWGSVSITALADMFGTEGVFWAILIIITLFMIGIWNPVVSIIMGTLAFGFMAILGVMNIGTVVISYVIILAVLIIWRLRT